MRRQRFIIATIGVHDDEVLLVHEVLPERLVHGLLLALDLVFVLVEFTVARSSPEAIQLRGLLLSLGKAGVVLLGLGGLARAQLLQLLLNLTQTS